MSGPSMVCLFQKGDLHVYYLVWLASLTKAVLCYTSAMMYIKDPHLSIVRKKHFEKAYVLPYMFLP